MSEEKFSQGDRVKPSKEAIDNNVGYEGMLGVISGRPQRGRDWHSKVLWLGKRVKENWHNDFLDLVK